MRTICFALTLLAMIALAGVGHARELRIGIGFALPPYVLKDEDRGLEVDIIRAALAKVGHTAVFVCLPNLRLPMEFAKGEVDAIAANAAYDLAKDAGVEVFPSHTTVAYQNYAVTLQSSGLSFRSVDDLADRKVLAFHNACKYLGPDFARMARENPQYHELADQSLHARMLYGDRTDVVISDKRIFLYWRQKLLHSAMEDALDITQPVVFHPIFSPAPRVVYFSRGDLRDAFDKGLTTIRKNGEYDAITALYTGVEHAQ